MSTFSLINIFNGFIRNYENFNLNINDKKEEFIKKENKFFIMVGQLLGFEVVSKKEKNSLQKKILWLDKDNSDKLFLTLIREDDLTDDLQNVQDLVSYLKKDSEDYVINIIETSSEKRIEYLNNIILTSNLCIKKDILVIYIIKDILNSKNYITAKLYKDNNNFFTKKAIVKFNGELFEGEFIVH